ncbi:DUF2061 domain-containing protein [Vibrio sp. S9_S30]|uniref:DUF2061 domain-containing protein n=1 Tax=Vibrio sp. S9_S30 TaxID=2720226 RepID=UPI0016805552|nr:DUF2061 domain-containing protein [Vibrio sp. S9_S30]MBD1557283.1 DUF2061 domain-containing protein [Vibrio sp. S9_S30]
MKKTLTFALLHFSIAFSVAYLLTGDILLGSLVAMLEPSVNTVAFYFHEKAWAQLSWLRRHQSRTQVKTASFASVHFGVAFTVTYLITGDAFIGGIMAVLEPSLNTVAYYFHERVWLKRSGLAPFCQHQHI